MDFFAYQDKARKQTALMVVLFLAAVACTVLAFNVLGGLVYIAVKGQPPFPLGQALSQVPGTTYWITTFIVLGIIAFGTASRLYALSGGGAAVAQMVGARRVQRDAGEPAERRLRNVVEEMAIASGINVPLVYVMDDQSHINAFAAGYSPNEAAITVTRGCLDLLSRDELQGVIAHEFSHILNGDMRLNVRLMGVVAGIVMIGSLGRFTMDLGSGGRRSGSSSGRNRGDLRLFFLGLAIWLIGSIGVLFGSLIKAAISRQREFLADASAVQFTRNAEGIGTALYKIGQSGSQVLERHAEELSHMYFGPPVSHLVFATHPPLDKRIERIMGPGAQYILRDRARRAEAAVHRAAPSPVVEAFVSPLYARSAQAGLDAGALAAAAPPAALTAATVMASIGTLNKTHVEHAGRFMADLPIVVRAALGTESGAQAAVFSLLLGEGDGREKQLAAIAEKIDKSTAEHTASIAEALKPLGVRARLPVFELAAPALSGLSQAQRDALQALVNTLIHADGRITLGEFVLQTLCRRHLEKPAKGTPPVKHHSLKSVAREARAVLGLLSRSSQAGEAAFGRVTASLGLETETGATMPPFTLPMVEKALYELKLLAPLKKPAFIKACLEIVVADGKINVTEGELVRAICAALDTPMPPLIENQSAWHEPAMMG